MIKYIAFYDKVAERYCSDLIPCDDSMALILRLAKRFTFSKYCSFVKPQEISCNLIAEWDSENIKKPLTLKNISLFSLDEVDTIYVKYAKSAGVEGVPGVTVPDAKLQNYGDFVREIEKKQLEEEKSDESK